MNKNRVITVDGPSGVGKGTLCYQLAQHFQFHLLDSGAIYRVLGLAALQQSIDFKDENALAHLVLQLDLQFSPKQGQTCILLNQQEVSHLIRTQEVANVASQIAVYPKVREALLQCQRDFARSPGLIADGRDMGTIVFPNACAKIFLDASATERANRRLKQLQNSGFSGNFEQILAEVKARDDRDRNRLVAPLVPAPDALVLDTTHLSIQEVFNKVVSFIESQLISL